nr:LacI family DNA-binding transcriptional regulator [Propionivibrio soli]
MVVTLLDVAKVAGVSRATVSLVCRDSPLVAEKTRKKVERAMAEVGYVYNRSAANLRSSFTNTVGLIIPDIANPVYSDLLTGVEDVLTPLGKAVFIADTNESEERQAHLLQRMLEMRVDGLVISTVGGTTAEDLAPYTRIGVPITQVFRMIEDAPFDYAGINNRLGCRRAAEHLLDLGHRHIGFIGSAVSPSVNQVRYGGFCDAVRSRDLPAESMPTITCKHTFGDAAVAAKKLISSAAAPTALVCFNDIIAFGATLGVYELGLTPGLDVSLVGFDDIESAANWRPPLTTMSIEARQIGRHAGTLLANRIKDLDLPVCSMVSEAVLKQRETTAPPRRAAV